MASTPASAPARRHIALFVPSLHYGGVERVMLNLARGFSERGQRVDLVAASAEGEFASEVPKGVRIVDLKSPRVLASLPGLVRYLRRERPEALLSAMDHSNVIALWARRIARVPTAVVVTTHCLSLEEVRSSARLRVKLTPFFMRHSYGKADVIVSVSRAVADEVAAIAGVARQAIRIISNPVITPELIESSRAPVAHEWFQPGRPPVILGVGRFVPAKGFHILLEAFSRVRAEARLVILGEGPQRDPLLRRAGELGLSADVWLPGFVRNPAAYLAKASVFVMPSSFEAFGLVLVEALALGTPAIASDTGGSREILGPAARLFPPGNIEALAEAIRQALADRRQSPVPDLRRYTLAEVTLQYLQVIDSCCQRRPCPPTSHDRAEKMFLPSPRC